MHKPSAVLFLTALALALPALGLPVDEVIAGTHQLAERNFGGGGLAINCPSDWRKIVGGSKGTWYHHWQVTDNIYCGVNSECSIAETEEHTFGVEASFSIDIGSKSVGGSLGVTIVNEWTSGQQATCTGETGETLCVWRVAEYKAFDTDTIVDTCNNRGIKEAKFPVAGGGQGGYQCVKGKEYCRSKDSHYWDKQVV